MPVASKLEKAYLRLHTPTESGPGGTMGEVRFQFNPKEFTVAKSSQWESKPSKAAKAAAKPEFKGADPRTINLEVFLDGTESDKDITTDIETLFKCCTPVPGTLVKKKPSPPYVVFGWGKKVSVTCFVKKVSVKYTLFKPEGDPTRAVCTVELQEVPGDPPGQNPTSGGSAKRTHTMLAGESLAAVAHQEYGNPAFWRALAVVNRIDDPMRIPAGRRLLIPPDDEAAALA